MLRRSRFRLRGIPGAAAVAGLALLLASCSSSGGTSPSASHGSPAGAISGYLLALSNSHNSSACGWVAPNEQSACQSLIADISVHQSGFTIGNTYTDGNQALVAVIANNFCITESSTTTSEACHSNSDKSAGLPSSNAGFASAYSDSFSNNASPDAAAVEVDGQWYAALGPDAGGSTTGTTGTTGSSTTGATGSLPTGTTGTSTTGTGTTGTTGTSTTGTTGSGTT